ncbi:MULTISPECIES: hypothetical protein [Bradyrhizobium]|uniref:Uncharacterized protein n=1 Tax=Bradyrhizobium septentrionale TaxID=1404411 RepID=A0A974A732_9BRAD|nr:MULTISPECIES: hypothetical protein [Bradyrhizobium]MCK7664766.1 hypothetical protein [Bradyrhizobium sp. 2S1]MCK7664779.1 hypothetical protein [Bradyrhizobium sp. 2S1]UGY30266.1 hypothetical protein HU675_0049980 [Bradyrhizobium septentrionale]UGY30278.1 hypothetical protein HU675_0050080 [Bradyrhizobium septentrionale]
MINGTASVPSYSADYALTDGQSLYSTMVLLMMERHGIYETELRADYASMQARNNLLKDLNSALATMRAERPNDEKTVRSYGTFIDSQGKTRSVYEFLQANGIAIETNCNDVYGIQAEFDAAINNVRAAIDSANSEGQMAVISLQGLLDKLNQVTELTSNVLSKDEKANEAVIGNIR